MDVGENASSSSKLVEEWSSGAYSRVHLVRVSVGLADDARIIPPNEPATSVPMPVAEAPLVDMPPALPSRLPKHPAKRGTVEKPALAMPWRVGTRAHPLVVPVLN